MTDKIPTALNLPLRDTSDAPRRLVRLKGGGRPKHSLSGALREAGLTSFLGRPVDLPALEIGETIRLARQSRGLTQRALAERLGCKQSEISDIERGRGHDGPRYATLKRIAEALAVALPVNPGGEPLAALPDAAQGDSPTVLAIEAEADDQVTSSSGAFHNYVSLFSKSELTALRNHVRSGLKSFKTFRDECHVVTFEPGASARIHGAANELLVARIKGGGDYRAVRAISRYRPGRKAGHKDPAVALLGSSSELEVTADSDGLTLMVLPPEALGKITP